jgi:SAM-dependent methyltransferase
MSGLIRLLKRYLRKSVVGLLGLLPQASVLRFLFFLDNWLYFLQGQAAIAYGKGVSPKHRLTDYHGFFVQHTPPGARVLDIGCGNGALALDLAEQAQAQVVGVELDPAKVADAQRRHPHPRITYLAGDARRQLPGGAFEVVILSNVLEHLSDRPVFLAQVVEAAQPSRILIRVPLFERDWRVPLKRELGVEWRLDPTHEIEYTLEAFSHEMRQAGLTVLHQEQRWGEIWAVTEPLEPTGLKPEQDGGKKPGA